MTNPAPDPSALGGPGGLDVRLARPRLTPTGTRRARLRRRLETAALKSSDKAAAATIIADLVALKRAVVTSDRHTTHGNGYAARQG